MTAPGTTWTGESIQDSEILAELPSDLVCILRKNNGFILNNGALHVRGASLIPEWHLLREARRGPNAFQKLYENVKPLDVPFAQDQFGDQFLIREGAIIRLSAETGETECIAASFQEFFDNVNSDIENFLNVGLQHEMKPGELLLAAPPFCLKSDAAPSLKPVPALEVILFHADFAKQIRNILDGEEIEFRVREYSGDGEREGKL